MVFASEDSGIGGQTVHSRLSTPGDWHARGVVGTAALALCLERLQNCRDMILGRPELEVSLRGPRSSIDVTDQNRFPS
jgi:hypothetical protein